MSATEIVDAALRLLEVLISWPIVLLVVVIIIRHELPGLVVKLADRLRKAPGGFEFDELRGEVQTLAQTVKRIEEAVVFRPSAALPPALEQRLQTSLSRFYEYFKALGFEPREGRPEVSVQSGLNNAYYDGSKNLIVIGESLAADEDVSLREYAHHVLTSAAPPQENSSWAYRAIESGLADYFPCSFTDDALLAEEWARQAFDRPYIRNLDNERRFTEITQDTMYQDAGEVWAGAFWEMRKLLQQGVADRLLFSAWAAQSPADIRRIDPEGFVRKLADAARYSVDRDAADTIRSVFQRRGLDS